MKKIIALLLTLVMVCGLFAACAKTETAQQTTEQTEAANNIQQSESAEEQPSAEPSEAAEAAAPAEPVESSEAAETAESSEEPAAAAVEAYDYTYRPAAEEHDTLTMYATEINLMGDLGTLGIDSFDDFGYYKQVVEATNMDLEAQYVSFFAWSELYPLWIAAGEWSDIVLGGSYTGGLEQGVEDEFVLDLTDYVEEMMPNYYHRILDHDYVSSATTDGRWLDVKSMYDEFKTNEGLLIRKDWLDAAGLDVPETWDEYHEAMVAFKNLFDPEWVVYITGSCALSSFGGLSVPYYNVGQSNTPFYQKDGTVYTSLISDEYRNYLKRLNQYWNEGLLNPDFLSETYDPHSQSFSGWITGNNMGIWTENIEGLGTTLSYELPEGFEALPVVGPKDYEGQINANAQPTMGDMPGLLVTVEASDHLENVLSWVDYWFSNEGANTYNYGELGVDYTLDENGEPTFTDAIINNEFGMTVTSYMRCRCPYAVLAGYGYRARTAFEYNDTQLAAWDVWTAAVEGSQVLPQTMTMDLALSNEQNILVNDICTLADEWVAKFVIGDRDIDTEWEEFVGILKNMGIDRVVEIEQITLDTYLNG